MRQQFEATSEVLTQQSRDLLPPFIEQDQFIRGTHAAHFAFVVRSSTYAHQGFGPLRASDAGLPRRGPEQRSGLLLTACSLSVCGGSTGRRRWTLQSLLLPGSQSHRGEATRRRRVGSI